jgi:hypothetical protein
MAETRNETMERDKDGTMVRRTVVEERIPGASVPKVKRFRLKAGTRHFHEGTMLTNGEVDLTEDQARAFRDKFEPVDDSEFEEQSKSAQKRNTSSKESDAVKENRERMLEEGEGGEEPTQGTAVPQAPIVVNPMSGPRDPNSAPVDPSSIDPARQGQQSREMRQFIDSGQLPAPAPVEETVSKAREISQSSGAGLRTDGPSLDEWTKSGKKAADYPPPGYADKRGTSGVATSSGSKGGDKEPEKVSSKEVSKK